MAAKEEAEGAKKFAKVGGTISANDRRRRHASGRRKRRNSAPRNRKPSFGW